MHAIKGKLEAGGYGWGHAKKDLLNLILERFAEERERFNYFMENPEDLEKVLQEGEAKAREIAQAKLKEIRKKLGFGI